MRSTPRFAALWAALLSLFLPDGRTLVATVFGSNELQFVPTDRP